MKTLLLFMVLSTASMHAQYEGLWEGMTENGGHVSRQLIALAEATPPDKFAWRPAPGVRSTSEVYMHIALANFYLLSVTCLTHAGGHKVQRYGKGRDLEDECDRFSETLS